MRKLAILTSLVFLPISVASAQNLQPQSQQEFQRVFGAGVPQTSTANASTRSALQPASIAEFRRVFGANTISAAVELQSMSTPETVDSTFLNAMLGSTDPKRFFMLWHLVAVDITAIDHRAILTASPNTFHEQFGPARTARALGLIHLAMFEAANIFDRKYTSKLSGIEAIPTAGASSDAAITEAAYQVIAWLYPGLNDQIVDPSDATLCYSSGFSLARYYSCSLMQISDQSAREKGIAVGRAIAGKIIADRDHDGAERPEPIWNAGSGPFGTFTPRRTDVGSPDYPFLQWQIDPVSKLTTALGGNWAQVKPLAMTSAFQFRPQDSSSPASLIPKGANNESVYDKLPSYNAITQWGREPRLDGTGKDVPTSNDDRVFVAQFWAYDGTINLCAPARFYNQIAAAVLDQIAQHPDNSYPGVIDVNSTVDVARYYALLNIAMADASIAAWDAKYFFQFPRPVTYIRGLQELDSAKNKKPLPPPWFPLGAQNTNSDQPYNITPPFPSYPSGHAVFGGSLFGVLRQYIKPSAEFKFMSDEFNGKNKDVYNYIRCSPGDQITFKDKFCVKRTMTVNCSERENADSRLFMGVHWVFDADDGIVMGNRIAKQVYEGVMQPLSGPAASQLYSVDPAQVKTRDALKCPGLNYPMGWNDPDNTKGLGSLKITVVN